ncbi:hypothetical protein M426DRAFT_323612 [Hypoxylon sp. CI-4A]|nr:hypothetical protein M426DRAFT_323612 [Hypoxylon sp. CI-4A]
MAQKRNDQLSKSSDRSAGSGGIRHSTLGGEHAIGPKHPSLENREGGRAISLDTKKGEAN